MTIYFKAFQITKNPMKVKIKVINNSDGNINCSYVVYGERADGEKLIVEYEGESPADYPGNNGEYSVVGWNYDIRT